MVCGNFNEILYTYEKEEYQGKRDEDVRRIKKIFHFEAWLILEETFEGEVRRLWEASLGNVMEKLTILTMLPALNGWHCFLVFSIHHLPQSFSDHCPLYIQTIQEDAWWILEKTFEGKSEDYGRQVRGFKRLGKESSNKTRRLIQDLTKELDYLND
ncbi:hypothetical protein EPI10_010867 [Gossypium australe]|uniref:Reverse transcriptase n=1 Tax=Gossypium australe TaxID=47621 RepID=A0A5B6W6T9_9ROSI|nr:hypothetical protein EPI10_010867 [Gossypium australe]